MHALLELRWPKILCARSIVCVYIGTHISFFNGDLCTVRGDIAGAADRETTAAGEGATGEADVGEGRRHAVRRELLRGAAA